MKIGTVRWFNIEKGRGYIHPDDGGPNIFVDRPAVERAGMSDLKIGQRIAFEIQRNERTGDISAVSLKVLAPATPAQFDRSLTTAKSFRHHLCLYFIGNVADLAARKNVTSIRCWLTRPALCLISRSACVSNDQGRCAADKKHRWKAI